MEEQQKEENWYQFDRTEKQFLKLDCYLIGQCIGWHRTWFTNHWQFFGADHFLNALVIFMMVMYSKNVFIFKIIQHDHHLRIWDVFTLTIRTDNNSFICFSLRENIGCTLGWFMLKLIHVNFEDIQILHHEQYFKIREVIFYDTDVFLNIFESSENHHPFGIKNLFRIDFVLFVISKSYTIISFIFYFFQTCWRPRKSSLCTWCFKFFSGISFCFGILYSRSVGKSWVIHGICSKAFSPGSLFWQNDLSNEPVISKNQKLIIGNKNPKTNNWFYWWFAHSMDVISLSRDVILHVSFWYIVSLSKDQRHLSGGKKTIWWCPSSSVNTWLFQSHLKINLRRDATNDRWDRFSHALRFTYCQNFSLYENVSVLKIVRKCFFFSA